MNADSRMSINDRMNLVFQDSDIMPLFVQVSAPAVQPAHYANASCASQENYVNLRPNAAGGSDLQRLVRRAVLGRQHLCASELRPFPCQELLARASSSIADGDVLMSAVRRYQARARWRTYFECPP